MANALGYDEHLARFQLDRFLFHFDPHAPGQDEKHFVLLFMGMPREFAFDFCDFDKRIVDTSHNPGRPEFGQGSGNFFR